MNATVSPQEILTAIQSALEPLDYVKAMWQGGAAAFNRVDQWSDIDVIAIAEDEHAEEVFPVVEAALEKLSPVSARFEIPQPTWHGHFQTLYKLDAASPYHFIDLAVEKESSDNRFLEPEIHGHAVVAFDKGDFTSGQTLDKGTHIETLRKRAEALKLQFDFFQVLTSKELHRGNWVEAQSYYQGFTLRPLVELLRIQHNPARYNFATRYFYYDLPAEITRQLEPLFFPQPGEDFATKLQSAQDLFEETHSSLDWARVETLLNEA